MRTLRHKEDGNPGMSGTHNRPFRAEATDLQSVKTLLDSSEPRRNPGSQEERLRERMGDRLLKCVDPLIPWGVLGPIPPLRTALQGSHLPGLESTSPTEAQKALNDMPPPPRCFHLLPFSPAFPGEAAVPRAPGDSPACDVPVDRAESSGATKEHGDHAGR